MIETIKNKDDEQLKNAYSTSLPITKKKYNNLKTMCEENTIPPRYHSEYLSLKHSTAVADVLNETDIEDVIE